MKGVIFTEFLDMVEGRFSLRTLDTMLTQSRVRSAGAYTAVGTYDHRELHALVHQLSLLVGQAADVILEEFGRYLFAHLVARYPTLVKPYHDTFAVLANLGSLQSAPIPQPAPCPAHVRFTHQLLDGHSLRLRYDASSGLAALAHGLLQGCAEFFGEQIRIERNDSSDGQTCFLLTKQSAT